MIGSYCWAGGKEERRLRQEGMRAARLPGRLEDKKAGRQARRIHIGRNANLSKSQLAKNVGQSLWSFFVLVDFLVS